MALGFEIVVDSGTYYRPDKSLRRKSKPKVHLATFGDGYEQRLADGINSITEIYSVSFATRPKADIDDIVAFFDSKQGVTAFDFTIPDSNGSEAGGTETTIKVVCDDFDISYDYGDFYSASAKFRRVYEA